MDDEGLSRAERSRLAPAGSNPRGGSPWRRARLRQRGRHKM